MMRKARILAVLSLFFLNQCGEKASKLDPAYVGVWKGYDAFSTYNLTIDKHDNAFWTRNDGGRYTSAQGTAWVKDNVLRIGFKRLEIDQQPQFDTATQVWSMILSGAYYSR
jgi:hypothetical protein